MLYTRLGRIVAALALLLGILWVVIGAAMFYIAQSVEPFEHLAQLERLFRWIEEGILIVIFAIALGVLTEISRSVRANITNTPG